MTTATAVPIAVAPLPPSSLLSEQKPNILWIVPL